VSYLVIDHCYCGLT